MKARISFKLFNPKITIGPKVDRKTAGIFKKNNHGKNI